MHGDRIPKIIIYTWWSMRRTAPTKRTSDSDRVPFVRSGIREIDPPGSEVRPRGTRRRPTVASRIILMLESLCLTRFGCDRRRRAHAILSLYCLYTSCASMWRQFHVYNRYAHNSMYVCMCVCLCVCVYTLYRPAARTEVVGIKRVLPRVDVNRSLLIYAFYMRCGTNIMFRCIETRV